MPPDELMRLPPVLLQALGIDPAALPQAQIPQDSTMGAPSAMGGIPGAPATPVLPGLNHTLTPKPPGPQTPQAGINSASARGGTAQPSRPAGRPRGQSRAPQRRQRPYNG